VSLAGEIRNPSGRLARPETSAIGGHGPSLDHRVKVTDAPLNSIAVQYSIDEVGAKAEVLPMNSIAAQSQSDQSGMTFLRIVIPLYLFCLSMIFSRTGTHFSGSGSKSICCISS
jgi:hypothetical protein